MTETDALARFASGETLGARVEALRQLLASKGQPRELDPALLASGVSALRDAAERDDDPRGRIVAVAALARMVRADDRAKRPRFDVGDALDRALGRPLPPLDTLSDPDDRELVAAACERATGGWVAPYLARVVVHEESAEKTRRAASDVLVARAPSFSDAASLVQAELRAWSPATGAPADSAGRRLRRVLEALRAAISAAPERVTASAGGALADVVRAAIKTDAPASEPVAIEVAEETLRFVHELVRARFSLAMDAETYAAIRAATGWFARSSWSRVAPGLEAARAVVSDLSEAITVIARQGRGDDGLFECLAVACGSTERAREITAAISRRYTGLSPAVSAWLNGSALGAEAPSRTTDAATESRLAAEAEEVALLLRDADEVFASLEFLEHELVPELAITAPVAVPALRGLRTRGRAIVDGVRSLASRRGLVIRSAVGTVEEFSPVDHVLVGGDPGVRWVRITRPGVDVVRPDGVRFVVVRALGEPASPPEGR